jgi:hypothetical protein
MVIFQSFPAQMCRLGAGGIAHQYYRTSTPFFQNRERLPVTPKAITLRSNNGPNVPLSGEDKKR